MLEQRLHPSDDFRSRDAQYVRQTHDGSDARTLHTAFNQADKSPVETRIETQLLLRDPRLLPDVPERLTEGLFRPPFGLSLPVCALDQETMLDGRRLKSHGL